jgi:hypothetical protein
MTASAVDFFDASPTLDNPLGFGLHSTATRDWRINNRVVDLLNTAVSDPAFGVFPATGGQ